MTTSTHDDFNRDNGVQLPPPEPLPDAFHPDMTIPHFYSLSPVPIYSSLPILPTARRALLYDSLDLHHPHLCIRRDFHTDRTESCICKFCNQNADFYHRFSYPRLSHLTPCAALRITRSFTKNTVFRRPERDDSDRSNLTFV